MYQRPARPPASVKNANNFFPSSPFSKGTDDYKKRTKAQNLLFQMLMNDAIIKSGEQQQRRCSKSKIPISNITTPHSLYVGDKQRRTNNSLQKRLEETYQLQMSTTIASKTSKTRTPHQNSFNSQTTNWYMPKKREPSLKQKQFNQTVPHRQNYYLNSSLEGQNTAEVSFENNILQRGFQGDYSGYLQIQSDTSKNILDEAHFSGQVVRQVGQHHPRAMDLLDRGKEQLRNKQIPQAIESLRESVNIDPTLLESHYFLGIAYLGNLQYPKAISEFQSIISQDSAHRKNVYLLLAISFKKINELEQAINSLTKSLSLFPRYYDALIYRGKLLIRQKQLDKALADFNAAIQLSPQKGLGYLGKADCQRYAGNFQEAIRTYQKAITCEQAVSQAAFLKKAITLFEARDYDQSVKDLNTLLENDPSNSEAYYFKGLCKLKLRNTQEASLCFEQSIKHNNSKKAVTKSLYEIARIKIEQRDFYAAYHTLNRADFLDTEKTYLEKFRLFTEAVIFLMKRKFPESLVNFQSIQQNHSLNEFLKPLFYAYRAYGHFCLSNHQKSLEDYKSLIEAVGQLDQGAQYNRLLCEGILRVQQQQFERGIEFFERGGKVYPRKMEPIFYHGVTLINKAFHGQVRSGQEKMKLVIQGLQLIDQAQALNEQNANVFYIRAIIKAFLQNHGDAVADVDKAIEKSEDNVPKYFYFRGLVYGCSKQYKSAVNDFSICINLDENFADAYLQRAKCQFLYGDSNQAFADLQTYISLQPEDPNIHVWAGHFLFANAAVEDAVKAYTQSPKFTENPQLILARAQCYLVLGALQECLSDVSLLWQITKDKRFDFDRECIMAIMVVFRDSQEIYFDEENEDERLDLQKRLSQTTQLITQLATNKINGRLFKQHHLYIFRGVCLFHLRRYEDALKDFQMAKNQKEIWITEKRVERARRESRKSFSDLFAVPLELEVETVGEITEEEEDADLLEILEIRFNELACMVQLRMFRKARDKCIQLMENINEAKQEGLQYLLIALETEIHRTDGKDHGRHETEYERVVCLYDEPKENPLCFQVPIVTVAYLNNMKIRLSFSLPKVSPPQLVPQFDRTLVSEISPLSVENKPEAPWIRRNEQQGDMIMFTDNIHMAEDIRLETEEHEKDEPTRIIDKKGKQQGSFIYNSDAVEEYEQPIDRNAMKKNLMLDDDIEERLKKILEKKAKQQR